jgi:hypothetical protein
MTAGRTIDYEALAQDAMRGVVRTVLTQVAKSGLPGEHHFYVSFDTSQPGVTLSKRLKEKYPEEMTIVLQHRFWDLTVTEDRFEVKLTFDGIPERLVVPFAAIKVFFDPSVRYGLQFEEAEPDSAAADRGEPEADPRTGGVRATTKSKPRPQRRPRVEKGGETATPPAMPRPVQASPAKAPTAPALSTVSSASKSAGEERPQQSVAVPVGAKIVSLSDFRKK